jgi:branched-chain amino acid aminotransferase
MKRASRRMHRFTFHNDRIVDSSIATVPVNVGGLVYGWGVFTMLRIYEGRPFAFDRHWARLVDHATRLRVNVPLNLKQGRAALNKLIEANRVQNGRARITVVKRDGGAWRTKAAGRGEEDEFLIFTSPEPAATTELHLTMSPNRILSTSPIAGIKRTAMLENVLALEEARSRGFSDAVILNERGEIVSATAANIFWVEADEVYTPSLATGCVAGVTRRLVRDITKRWKLHLVEGSFTIQRLLDAREVFLTSSIREIAIASSFDAREYSLKQARISKLISREFQKLIHDAKIAK